MAVDCSSDYCTVVLPVFRFVVSCYLMASIFEYLASGTSPSGTYGAAVMPDCRSRSVVPVHGSGFR